MNLILIILGTIVNIFTNATLSLRSKIVYKKLGYDIDLKTLSEIFIMVAAANVIAPFRLGGIVVRTYILKKIRLVPHKVNITATTIEQIVDVFVQIIVVVICVYFIGIGENINLTSKIIISSIALIGLLALFFWAGIKDLMYKTLVITERVIPNKVINIIRRKTKVRKNHFIEILNTIQDGQNRVKFLLMVILTTLLIYIIFPIHIYFFTVSFGIKLSVAQLFVIFWLPMFLGRVSGLPSGLGVREASMIYLLTTMGVDITNATAMTLTYRTFTLVGTAAYGTLLSLKYGINIFKLHKLKKEEGNTEEINDKSKA